MRLSELKGIGEKTEKLFAKLGIQTSEELLRFYPVSYREYPACTGAGTVRTGERCAVYVTIRKRPALRRTGRLDIVTAEGQDETGIIRLIWFNSPYIVSRLHAGMRYIFCGRAEVRGTSVYLEMPEIFTPAEYEEKTASLSPVYALTKGLRNKTVTKAVQEALRHLKPEEDVLPQGSRRILGLMDETDAIRQIHMPKDMEELAEARKRIVFDEFFWFILAVRTVRMGQTDTMSAFPMKRGWEAERSVEKLPYRLTNAQTAAWQQIENDLCSGRAMNRLLMGDVGSGKTILAFLAMQLASSNGYQSVLMAPTEVLASQHFDNLKNLVDGGVFPDLHPVLLTGQIRGKAREKILHEIETGKADCVIGTHALIQPSVQYHKLALAVTDEQHRFGVRQRKTFSENGQVHLMVMSATPIPRTLGIILYGDLDVTVLDEKPKNRLPIRNCVVDRSWRPNAWRFIEKQVAEGHQAYVVCPMIEESEGLSAENVLDYAKTLRASLPSLRIAVLHGRQKSDEKERIMRTFAEGGTDVLVSTTVIEVGVDVPNATVMMIEDAERFGLAALHQLRGRVGRGDAQSYCIFMRGNDSREAEERLSVLETSNDGFAIAEKDFELRGPGDLLGVRQSGDMMFRLADVARDGSILRDAAEFVSSILTEDPELTDPEHAALREKREAYLQQMEANLVL